MKKKLLKILLFLTIFTGIVITGKAQSSDKPFYFGARLGTSSSSFTHNLESFSNKRLGVACGAFAELKPIKILGFSLEINYLQQGAFHVNSGYIYPNTELTIGNVSKSSSDVKLHTLNIPLLINFRPVEDEDITPKISIGFFYDYIIAARSRDLLYIYDPNAFNFRTLSDRAFEDVTSSFKQYNYGPLAALGIDFKSKSLIYSLEARYSIGLNHVNDLATLNNVTSNSFKYDFSYNTLSITLGIAY